MLETFTGQRATSGITPSARLTLCKKEVTLHTRKTRSTIYIDLCYIIVRITGKIGI